jgi:hypothetical protein
VRLWGNFARAQLVVAADPGSAPSDLADDLTHAATFASSDPAVATVDATGQVLAVANGQATLTISAAGVSRQVPVIVDGVLPDPAIGFDSHVLPILSKLGCNLGACHAAQHGKGGFKLSVFGFDPAADRDAIVRERQGRRVDLMNPERSLFLRKPTLQVRHGGGQRLEAGSVDFQILASWLRSGAPGHDPKALKVAQLNVWPRQRRAPIGAVQQLRVEATYSDGTTRDVTAWAKFDSMDEAILEVSRSGRVTVRGQGQAPIMVRFEGQAQISLFVVPFGPPARLEGWQNQNFIDELAAEKLRQLGIEPSPVCDDATFVRRAFLDAIGTLPAPEETLAFIHSTESNKRERLVDRLLGLTGDPALDIYNNQYAAYWSLKWSDLLRNTSDKLGEQGMWAMHNWIKDSFRTNKPFDRFVRELVTAKGSIFSNGPANYFRVNGSPTDLTEATAQTFLGIRLECAKCHHHPFEKYGQEDYYSFAAFFSRVGSKTSREFGLFGGESVVMVNAGGDVRHPRTGQVMQPTPLEGARVDHPLDRRLALADWLASPHNEFFARNVVNRYMAYLLGRGLVEPVDDMRSTNPPSNPALLDALAKDFVAGGFNLKKLIRAIMTSRIYQLDSQPTAGNAADHRFYSHYKVKRLAAEPLADAIDQATGVQTKYQNLPLGTRAIELPDAEYPSYFLVTFGKPRRASVCECERSPDENLGQALHTLNGDTLAGKIAAGNGRVAKLLAAQKTHDEIVHELYVATLCRPPSAEEVAASREFLAMAPNPKECYEDLLWGLMNSKQFLFVR